MDASCKIQGSIHSFFLVHNMCPELWVHIKIELYLSNFRGAFHSCQTFFYLTGICSGGKVRERPEGENCESNFSESPSNCVAKQVLGNEVSVKKLVELLETTT